MLVAYFVQNLFIFELPVSYMMFYAFLGLLVFVAEETNTSRRAHPLVAQKAGSPRLTGRQRIAVGLVAALMIFNIVEFNLKAFVEAELGARMVDFLNDPKRFRDDFTAALSYRSWPTDEIVAMAADELSATGKASDPGYAKAGGEVAAEIERNIAARKDLDPRTYFRLGILCNRLAVADRSYFPKGKAALEAGIQRFPQWPEGYDALGENYLLQGKTDEGLALFERAVEINPSNAGAHWMYAFAMLWNHREREGLAELDAALNTHYDYHHPKELKQLINVYCKFGNFPKAIQFEKELVELEPRVAAHHEALAELYKDFGNRAEALQEMRTAVELDPRYASRSRAFFSSLQSDGNAAEQATLPNP